jgi:hypothetical protein
VGNADGLSNYGRCIMVGSGSKVLIAKFRPIISTEALCIIWTNHGTYWLIIRPLYWWYPIIAF